MKCLIVGSNAEIHSETIMYTVATIAALTYPSQCLPDELLEAKIKVTMMIILQCIVFISIVSQVANSLALKLLDTNYVPFREAWLGQFHTPKCSSNILKVRLACKSSINR